jgi:hypothetical protein
VADKVKRDYNSKKASNAAAYRYAAEAGALWGPCTALAAPSGLKIPEKELQQ